MRVSAVVVLLLVHAIQTPAAQQSDTVTVAPDANSPTAGIQEAIDRLGPGGGEVRIPPGEYLLRRAVRVRSGVTLQGAGKETVIRKNKQVGSKLAAATSGRSARVEDATGFREGDEVAFYDRTTVGWQQGHAIVTGVQGNELMLSWNPGKFDPANGGAVINTFSAIKGVRSAKGSVLSNVVLKDLTIDGNSEENPGPAVVCPRAPGTPPELGFQFAAINIMDATGLRVEGCRVKGWPADGISVQRGSGNRVTKCVVEECRGPGYHAGGGERDTVFSENEARGNLDDGFYFCVRVTGVTLKENKFIANRGNGVGGLGGGDDRKNVVEGNLCEGNGLSGISAKGGESNTLKNNVCVNNSQKSPGQWSGISLLRTSKSVVSGNRCSDNQKTQTQKHGISESPDCRGNEITNNDCRGNAQSGVALAGKDGQQSGNQE